MDAEQEGSPAAERPKENEMSRPTMGTIAILSIGMLCISWVAYGDDVVSKPSTAAAVSRGADRELLGFTGALLIQLRVKDLDRAIAYYRDVLGFEFYHRSDELSWAKLRSPVQHVTVGLGTSLEPRGSGTLSLNFSVKDIATARAALEKRGVVFKGPTVTIPEVVKLADFDDPDGNTIRLAQGLDPSEE